MTALALSELRRKVGKTTVLDGLDLSVEEGELFCLLGPLGAGKSSLLRCIAGLDEPTSGKVILGGQDVTAVPANRRGVSMFFENLSLYPHKTGFENLAFPLRRQRVPRAEVKRRVAEMAEILGIGHILERQPGTYSGGERQRLALGRTLIRPAKVYLLDEPLTNLDALLRVHMRSELKRLQRDLGRTIVYSTPDPVEALAVGDRVCVLDHGVVQQITEPLDLYRHPTNRMVAGFVGSPPMNFIPTTLERTAGRLVARARSLEVDLTERWPSDVPVPSGDITLAVRPENVVLAPADLSDATTEVFAVEPLGAKTVVDLMLDDVLIKALVRGQPTVSVGADQGITVDARHVHVIEEGSGKVVL